MLVVNPELAIPESEFSWSFVRAGGPGGQNVNKVASKAVLRWNLLASPSVPAEVKARLATREPGRLTTTGEMLITSQRFRDQERNRQDCLEKLASMLRTAAIAPRRRKKTRPSRGSIERRLQTKRRRSGTKSARQSPDAE